MRLTNCLCRRKLGFIFKQKWKIASQKKLIETDVPEALLQKGVQIVDAMEVAMPKENLPEPTDIKVEMPEPYFVKKPSGRDHPSWKSRICHIFHNNTRLLEGLEQAQLLTKTVVHEGLPKQITNLMDKIPVLPDRDEILKRYILQSTVWDGSQKLLPRRLDFKRPGYVFPRDYGITTARKIITLSYNLLRLLDNQVASFEDSSNRSMYRNCHIRVPIEKDGDLLKFDFEAAVIITGVNPLAPFADADEVDRQTSTTLPDISPISHTVDLSQTNIYELDEFFPLPITAAQPYVHTLYQHNYRPYPMWLPRHVIAKALSATFAFSVAQARRNATTMGTGRLDEPIAMQCVVTDGQEFSLLAFQLNTLDLHGRDGVKNMAWIETGLKLYEKSEKVDGKLTFEGFNPKVADRLSALHLNGLDLTKTRAALLTSTSQMPSETTVTGSQSIG